MKGKRNIPKTSIALMLAAVLLLTGGTVLAATNAPDIISEDYKSEFELDHIDVALMENGVQSDKISSGSLLGALGGKAQPGRSYKTELAAKNMTDTDEIVRMIIRVYWIDADGNKDVTVDPGLIELSYGDDQYNSENWQINDRETTAERRVFYLNTILPAGETSAPVVSAIRVNNKVLDDVEVTEDRQGSKTVYTYRYRYEGYSICVDADVQSVQSHNPDDAVRSAWGVQNVTVSGDTVTVR